MRITIIIATILLFSVDLFAQGGVDVRYIAIDTVKGDLIGQKVKIDFKSAKGAKEYLIQKARIPDTVKITIDNQSIHVIERKGTGVDYWYFDKEYLESFDYKPDLVLRITDIELIDMSTDSIQFRMTIEKFKKARETLKPVSQEIKDTWIIKDKIEGILLKK